MKSMKSIFCLPVFGFFGIWQLKTETCDDFLSSADARTASYAPAFFKTQSLSKNGKKQVSTQLSEDSSESYTCLLFVLWFDLQNTDLWL